LPEALLNDLVRLGWSHHDQEIFSMEEMIRHFDLAHVSRSPAVFNYEKLDWLNQHYLKQGSLPYIQSALLEQLRRMGVEVMPSFEAWGPLIQALVERSKTLLELAEKARCYVEQHVQYSDGLMCQSFGASAKPMLEHIYQTLQALSDWSKESIHEAIQSLCASLALGMGKIAQPLRLVVTGTTQSPSIDETLVLVGRSRTLERLNYVIQHYCV
jgi:glutamyl-tRNA synthetase